MTRLPFGFWCFVCCWVIVGCTRTVSPEEQIRARLQDGVTALEENRLADAVAVLHRDYLDGTGRDRKTLRAIGFWILRQGPLRLRSDVTDVQVAADGKTAQLAVHVTGVQGAARIEQLSDLMPQGARQLSLNIAWREDDGTWWITAVEGDGFSLDVP